MTDMSEASQFAALESEMLPYKALLANAAEVIRDQDVSSYPIFVVHPNSIDIGINIVDRRKTGGKWSVNASTLEELTTKQIIADHKIDDFKLLYKSHQGDLCLFWVVESSAKFVFLPQGPLEQ